MNNPLNSRPPGEHQETHRDCDSACGETRESLRNEDPLSGEAGAHPIGSGIGAALGGLAAGAAAGSVAGPIGTVVGAIVGGIAGGLGGKAVAEELDPTVELGHLRETYSSRAYYDPARPFDVYEPAYRTGLMNFEEGIRFEERESDLRKVWESTKAQSKLTWDQARLAIKDAWDHCAKECRRDDAGKKPRPR